MQLLKKDNKYYITQVVEDDHLLLETDKNTAHLIFNDCLGQIMAGKKAKVNLNLNLNKDK